MDNNNYCDCWFSISVTNIAFFVKKWTRISHVIVIIYYLLKNLDGLCSYLFLFKRINVIAIKLAAIERISVEANSVNIQSNIDTIPKINADTAIPKNTQLKILIFKLVYLQINLIMFIFIS